MTTRIKIDSATNRIDVYKNLPSTDPNKTYILTVEDLVIPNICDALVLDGTPLFSVRRRVLTGVDGGALPPVPMEFTPSHCRNVAELLWQMNEFFRTKLLQCIHEGFAYNVAHHQYVVPVDFTQNNGNWHTDIRTSLRGARAHNALSAVFRSDGRIGFRFTVDALKLFVIDFSLEGRRVFGWPRKTVAVNDVGEFTGEYVTDDDPFAAFDLALEADLDEVYCFMDGSIFSHQTYRHEVVLNSSIPLERKIEFSNNKQKFSTQIVSHRLSQDNQSIEYEQRDRWLTNKNVNVYHFEKSGNNQFILKHSDMQNFHIQLMSRNYHYIQGSNSYESKEEPYTIPEGAFWYVTLAIKPL